ncbi:hypothetical protein [Neptunomonas sp. XY-337]|uniref:hypothetical protein n=1 Tax=Neptunomonas sp. XY-337 TaxID=2561897 RepID=UPI0010AA84D6|nr:hypothetical protein [Neptunomonas sp. XY-337]
MTILVSFIGSLIAAFIAAFTAHHLATARMRKNELSKFQLAAYSDFLGAASRLAVSRRVGDTSNEIEDLAVLNDSKNRILIGGDRAVVEALIEFWKHGATLEREQEIIAFKHLASVIRESLGHKKYDIFDLEISNTMFKLEPSDFSYRASRSDG